MKFLKVALFGAWMAHVQVFLNNVKILKQK